MRGCSVSKLGCQLAWLSRPLLLGLALPLTALHAGETSATLQFRGLITNPSCTATVSTSRESEHEVRIALSLSQCSNNAVKAGALPLVRQIGKPAGSQLAQSDGVVLSVSASTTRVNLLVDNP
ncbi:hypothetical protein [Chitinimonas sp.]|uniref:hypothetical protein n=1 Tax=Chitinimonas sp. TaxID=1934313 RepID=UPI0035B24515